MKRIMLIVVAMLAVAIALGVVGRSSTLEASPEPLAADTPVERAREILERTKAAYQSAAALSDVLHVEITKPTGPPEVVDIPYKLGAGTDAWVDFAGTVATAIDDRVFVTRTTAANKYIDVPLEESLGRTLDDVFGAPANLPAPLALRAARGSDRSMQAMTLGWLKNASIAGHETQGDTHTVTLEAPNGKATVQIDGQTHLLQSTVVEWEAKPGYTLTARMTYSPEVMSSARGLIDFDPASRRLVTSINDLVPFGVGDEAPEFTLRTLDGESVTLSSLRGQVVVLDFWATWCGPCRRGLPFLQKFDDWTRTSQQPIRVFAVDTFERAPNDDQKIAKASQYWESQGFKMPTLLDLDSKVAARYRVQSIPMTFVIGPDGKLAAVHRGFDPNIEQKLKADAAEALASAG